MNYIESSVICNESYIFENEKMESLNRKIQNLENEFNSKYGNEIFNDYLAIAELLTEELILGTELAFCSGSKINNL
ncbi:hypothetical protein [Sebaldella sp. S0638]|uniref:hypothetical protein n=1 Tax=Sebaldella sp. S0638 TaxID=2957809 RepID=UPI00209D75AE|nr:hypothetical protein [Sebaldella sp. S0638]MCP1225298.1 hypothetical protein [Sebaldella sp. S0638]